MGYAFISYSTKNQSTGDALRQLLLQNGVEIWMAPLDIPAGSKYAQVINRAIRECSCVILILSDASQNSTWVAKEIERALNYHKVIIPIQVEELILNEEFELYLCNNQIIALRCLDEHQQSVQELIKTIQYHTNRIDKQEELKEPHFVADTTHHDTEAEFFDLFKRFYITMTEYRFAFQQGCQSEISRTTALMMKTMNHIYVVGEQYASTYPDISKKAIEVVNLYNKYVKAYSAFVDELRKGYGDKSNRLAQMAEKEFNNLLNCILKYIE